MIEPTFEYTALVTNIHDGDTMTVVIDCGFCVSYTTPLRFYGINAPELYTPEGKVAVAFLRTLVAIGDTVTIRTFKGHGDKYGRWLAEIDSRGVNLNQAMIDSGNAVPYFGVGPKMA